MKTLPSLAIITCVLLAGSGCQHAGTPSLKMQEKFFSSLEPANPAVEQTLRRVQYYQLAGRHDAALEELQAALQKEPRNIRLLNALGNCHDRLGAYSRAQEHYQKILQQDPANQLALNNLGYSFFLAGDLVQAEKCFQEVLAQNPDNTLARNNLGLVWCSQGKEQQALIFWEKKEGELLAREKLNQVLAHLGKVRNTPVPAPLADKSRTPESRPGPPDKPENPAPPPEMARLENNQVASRGTLSASEDERLNPGPSSPGSKNPGNLSPRPQVSIEEVEMVVQPAAYAPGPPSGEAAAGSGQPFLQLNTGKGVFGSSRKKSRLQAKAPEVQAVPDDDGTMALALPPRQRAARRAPKIITLAPETPQSPYKPLQEYILTGFTLHRHKSAGHQEMAVY